MKKDLRLQVLNIVFFLVTLFVNYLSVVHQLGGKTIRELSDQYDNLFTPSSQTFAIWSLIYVLLAVFLVLQFLEKYKSARVTSNAWFILSCALNAGWIICWQMEYVALSLVVMLALLSTLVMMNKQIQEDRPPFLKLVFGVYLGWICIATIANVTALLVSLHINPDMQIQVAITLGLLVIGAVLVYWIMRRLENPFLAIAVSWAFYGIYSKRMEDQSAIAITALVLAILVLLAGVFVWRRKA